MFAPLVVQGDQRIRGPGAMVAQRGGQPAGAAMAGAVAAGQRDRCDDDPHVYPTDQRQNRPVGKVAGDRRAPVGSQPDQELGLGGGDVAPERAAPNPRSISTSMVSSSRCISLRAQVTSPAAGVPNTAPISARGHPVGGVQLPRPAAVGRCAGDLDRFCARRRPPSGTGRTYPRHPGEPSGPASTSNSARSGAGRQAPGVGAGARRSPSATSAAVAPLPGTNETC